MAPPRSVEARRTVVVVTNYMKKEDYYGKGSDTKRSATEVFACG